MVLHWHNACKGSESYHWPELCETKAQCRFTILVSRPFPGGSSLIVNPPPRTHNQLLLLRGNKDSNKFVHYYCRLWMIALLILLDMLLSWWCYPWMFITPCFPEPPSLTLRLGFLPLSFIICKTAPYYCRMIVAHRHFLWSNSIPSQVLLPVYANLTTLDKFHTNDPQMDQLGSLFLTFTKPLQLSPKKVAPNH